MMLYQMMRLDFPTTGALAAIPLPRLEAAFGEEKGLWLLRLAHGALGGVGLGRSNGPGVEWSRQEWTRDYLWRWC